MRKVVKVVAISLAGIGAVIATVTTLDPLELDPYRFRLEQQAKKQRKQLRRQQREDRRWHWLLWLVQE